jgi:hypothetical protein
MAGPPLHVAWQVVHFYDKHPTTQVCTYVNRRLLSDFQISTNASHNANANILTFTLLGKLGAQLATFVNVYNQPKMSNTAVKILFSLMPDITDLRVLLGDFNIRSMDWEPTYTRCHDLATDLLAACIVQDLTLINDDGQPMWHHSKWGGSVLDLLFIHNSWLQCSRVIFENDSVNRGGSDHSILWLHFGNRDHRDRKQYIPKETDNELAFIKSIQKALTTAVATLNDLTKDIQSIFNTLYQSYHEAWEDNIKTAKAGSNPTHWWMEECELAKAVFEHTCNERDHKIYLDTTDATRKAFFDQKIVEMTRTRRPWEGMRWTGLRPPPSYPSIKDANNQQIKDPQKLFGHMHRHFSSMAASGCIDWDFIRKLPSHDNGQSLTSPRQKYSRP